jgi:predicted TIM-barrel fold metal-dependent hydrolase
MPSLIGKPGSGLDSYLHYGETRIQNKLCFATNWATQSITVGDLIAQVEALPFSDSTKDKILFENAVRFYNR